MILPADEYKKIIEVLPILCVDVVVRSKNGQCLLIKRANEPLKGVWWVIGGRVLKGETLEQAAIRKVREEASLEVGDVYPVGYYEDVAEKNPFGHGSGQHSVSIVFSGTVGDHQQIKLDHQSSDWKYSSELPTNFRVRSFIGENYG